MTNKTIIEFLEEKEEKKKLFDQAKEITNERDLNFLKILSPFPLQKTNGNGHLIFLKDGIAKQLEEAGLILIRVPGVGQEKNHETYLYFIKEKQNV